MHLGLSVYGTTFGMGIDPASGRLPIRPQQVMERALSAGLAGVELPVPLFEGEDCAALGRYAREHDLFITLAASSFAPDRLVKAIQLAEQLGAVTVRTMVGGAKIGGDRRPLAGHWQGFLQQVLAGFAEVAPIAERAGINLAVENHQDLASEELLWLCESLGSPRFGITLDTGNPLATAEEPLDFVRCVAPFVKNVHLKDYWVYLSEEGYRLVRCPLGQGITDFPAMLTMVRQANPDATLSIELGALEARHIRVLADDFWPEYPTRSASSFARVMRFVLSAAKSSGDWRTPFERNEAADAVIAYEERQLASSLAYIVPLFHTINSQQ